MSPLQSFFPRRLSTTAVFPLASAASFCDDIRKRCVGDADATKTNVERRQDWVGYTIATAATCGVFLERTAVRAARMTWFADFFLFVASRQR